VAGGGGILINPNGITEVKLSWGLVRRSNNQVEMCGLLQGLYIAKGKGVEDLIMLGDSLITIHHMNPNNLPKDNSLAKFI